MRGRWLAALIAGAVAACGISAVGEHEGASPSDDAGRDVAGPSTIDATPANDAGDDAPFDAEVVCDGGAPVPGMLLLPPDGATCPSGTTEETVRTSPAPVAGACACGACTVTSEPSCGGAGFTITAANNNACGTYSRTYNPVNDVCTDFGVGTFNLPSFLRWTARVPTPGACTAPATTDAAKATTSALRTCTAATPEIACDAVKAGARVCVPASDAGTCAAPYSTAVAIGDGATASCAACTCSRTAASCIVDYYGNTTCTDLKLTQTADGVCTASNQADVEAFRVHPSTPACTVTPGAASATLTNARTLCCTK